MTLFTTIIMTIKSKLYALFSKVRVWFSPSYLRNKGLAKLRTCISRLFDVKPKDREDYYPVFGWLVSKKLAYAVLTVVVVGCACYIGGMLPQKLGTEGYKTYKYNSVPLKFISGKVGILAEDGYLAYVGDVDQGTVSGTGSLYDARGRLVYEGEFDHNAYHGNGKRYDPNGVMRYEGGFQDNMFSGSGILYREGGSKEYEGEFLRDRKEGQGILYNGNESPIYTGTFRQGDILYQELLGRTMAEAAAKYTGQLRVYSGKNEYCAAMPEIQALYSTDSGSDTLDGEWKISGVYVLKPQVNLAGTCYTAIPEITEAFGQPIYEGNTAISLSDAIAVNEACSNGKILNGKVDMLSTGIFEDAVNIEGYDDGYLVYLYVYHIDGNIYTFYTMEKESGFAMYYIEAE